MFLFVHRDFNFPIINWSTLSCGISYLQTFLAAVHDSYLYQHYTKPTHYRPNTTSNILDLVILTNEGVMINTIQYTSQVLVPVIMFAFDQFELLC